MGKRLELIIDLFAEGGGASGGAAAGTAGGESAGGTQDAQGGTQGAPDRAAEFDAMIKGDYREEYEKRFKQGLDRRFKETESLRQQTEAVKPLTPSTMLSSIMAAASSALMIRSYPLSLLSLSLTFASTCMMIPPINSVLDRNSIP